MASTVSPSRSARYARWLAVPVGLVISAVLIWQASYAAFTDTTANRDNSWTAGSVTITDNDEGRAMFSATDLAPGAKAFKDITVTYGGTLDAAVELYGTGLEVLKPSTDGTTPEPVVSGASLANHIWLTIEGSEGTTFGASDKGVLYEGTLARFAATHTAESTPMRYTVAGKSNMQGAFRFTYEVMSDAPDAVQGQQVTLDFVAEATSTS